MRRTLPRSAAADTSGDRPLFPSNASGCSAEDVLLAFRRTALPRSPGPQTCLVVPLAMRCGWRWRRSPSKHWLSSPSYAAEKARDGDGMKVRAPGAGESRKGFRPR